MLIKIDTINLATLGLTYFLSDLALGDQSLKEVDLII